MRYKLQDCLLSYIDNRGVTPTKLKGEFSSNNIGVRVLSANNVKSSGLIRLNEVRYVDHELYAKWMPSDIQRGDILLTSEAPAGEVLLWNSDEKVVVGQRLYALRVNPSVADAAYLAYYLQSAVGQREIMKNLTGSTVMGVSQKTFENIVVDLPPLAEQEKIGQTLLSIDEQIQRNNAMVHKLQVLGQAIFAQHFAHCSNQCSLMEFPYISVIKPGIKPFENGKRYLTTSDVNNSDINWDASTVQFSTRENRANMEPQAHSVWFAKLKNSVKHICIPARSALLNNYILSTGFCGLLCDDTAFEFMSALITYPSFESLKDKFAHGATMEAVNNDDLSCFVIPNPDFNTLESFHLATQSLYQQITDIQYSSYKLACMRNSLLPMLMNGQITV